MVPEMYVGGHFSRKIAKFGAKSKGKSGQIFEKSYFHALERDTSPEIDFSKSLEFC